MTRLEEIAKELINKIFKEQQKENNLIIEKALQEASIMGRAQIIIQNNKLIAMVKKLKALEEE